jgi:hypothetical protein
MDAPDFASSESESHADTEKHREHADESIFDQTQTIRRFLVSAAGRAIRTAAPVTNESDGLTMHFVRLRGADAY